MNQQAPAKKTAAKKPASKTAAARKTTAAKKTTVAKKTAAAKRAELKAVAEKTEAEAQHNPGMAIADQAAFAQAIGLDPNTIYPGSLRVEFNPQGVALVIFTTAIAVTPQQLGFAFMASSGMLGNGADGEPTPLPQTEPTEG